MLEHSVHAGEECMCWRRVYVLEESLCAGGESMCWRRVYMPEITVCSVTLVTWNLVLLGDPKNASNAARI